MIYVRTISAIALLAMLHSAHAEGDHKALGKNEGERTADAAVAGNKAMVPIEDVPGLPRVLLIGDSISLGYTLPTRTLLKGKANLHRVLRNCGTSNMGYTGTRPRSKSWLGDGKWDVIHFNHGIWDTKLNPKNGLPKVSDEKYAKNLTGIVEALKGTGATVIFATTTPIPENLLADTQGEPLPPKSRLFQNVTIKNAIAVQIMKERDVRVNDLYAYIYPNRQKYWNKNDLHFSKAGSEYLAKAVAKSIESALATRHD